jgi:hypothetical protein
MSPWRSPFFEELTGSQHVQPSTLISTWPDKIDYSLRAKEICPRWMCIDKGDTVRFKDRFRGKTFSIKKSRAKRKSPGCSKRCLVIIDDKPVIYDSIVKMVEAMGWKDDSVRRALRRDGVHRGYKIEIIREEEDK